MRSREQRAELRARWLSAPAETPSNPIGGELALVVAIAGIHLADHLAVPARVHLATHPVSGLGAVAAAFALGADLDDLGLGRDRLVAGLGHGAAAAGTTAAAIGAAGASPTTQEWFLDERVSDVTRGEVLFTSLVRIPIGTAVYEELIFRGVILGLALRRLPRLHALALSSVLFGLWHVLPSLADRHLHPATRRRHPIVVAAGAVAATTGAGFAFGLQRLRSGSVLTPMITHAATNAVAFAVGEAVARRRATRQPDGDCATVTA